MSHIRNVLAVLLLSSCTLSQNLRNKNVHCDELNQNTYYHQYYGWTNDGYNCVIRNYELSSDREYYIDKSEQIRNLTIRESSMETLPEKLFFHLTNLKTLSVTNTSLKHVNQIKIQSLTTLDLSLNQIDSLEENSFSACGNLQKIDLSNNKISEEIDFTIFGTLPHLQSLDLSYNGLKVLHPPSSMLSANMSLNLSSNALTTLHLDDLKLFRCQQLQAENNQISEISIGQATSTLRKLNLNQNTLGNNLQDICKCFNLTFLSLNSNNIDNIGTCFSLMKNLQTLNLQGNNIYQINRDSFHIGNQITILDLSFNHLEELDEYTMSVFSQLKYLYLDGNQLFSFYDNPKLFMPHLVQVGLSHNRFKCSKLYLTVKRLQETKVQLYVDNRLPVNTTNINGLGCYNNHEGELLKDSNTTDAFLDKTKEKLSFTLHKVDLLEEKINGISSGVKATVLHYQKIEDYINSLQQNVKSSDQKFFQLENLVKNLTQEKVKYHGYPSEASSQSNSLLSIIIFLLITVVVSIILFLVIKKFDKECFYHRRMLNNDTPLTNVSTIEV